MLTRTATLYVLGFFAVTATAAAQEPNFGRAVAMTGTELLIGQPVNWYGPGAVYVYRTDGAGQWRQRARLMASDSSRKDDFGRALAVDGNTLVVGAPRKRGTAGAAYVFERAAANAAWQQTAVIGAPGEGDHSDFAVALALAGNDLLIGSPNKDSTGVVYHYQRGRGKWTLLDTVRPDGNEPRLRSFGRALSWRGGWLMVGAPAADSLRGRVFFYQRQADRRFGAGTVVNAGQAVRARFGTSVLIDGDVAYAGAPGAARVFVLARDGVGAWTVQRELASPDSARGSEFGFAIATSNRELWVGAPNLRDGNGRVFRFRGDQAVAIDADSADGTHWPFNFGYAIAAAGNRAVVSMPQRDFGEGRVLALTRTSDWAPRQLLEGEIFTIGKAMKPGQQCEAGKIADFHCNNMQVVGHLPVGALGGERGVWVNDIWGWTDPETGREYALVARRDGMAFVDISIPSAPRLVGNLPRSKTSPPSVWRSIKTIGNYAFVVADGALAHGMQVFDLRRLRNVTNPPALFEPETTYHNVHSAHNVVADTTAGFVYIVGANGGGETCGGGLHMVDVRDPLAPKFAGCYNDRSGTNPRGYTHDAQCLIYGGPDTRYTGRQICIASNETEINISDVTDKAKPVLIGRNSYPNVGYAHQGWFDPEQRYFYMNDETDELDGLVAGTRTIVWDLAKLDDPVVAHMYIGPVPSSDHNLFVKDNRAYLANYGSGLRVLDISNRTRPREIGFFDSAPYNNDEPGHSAGVSGAWSNYPFFKSGVIIFTSVREGLFIVRVMDGKPAI